MQSFLQWAELKTLWGNRLLPENLDKLMSISLIGVEVKSFNPDPYIEYSIRANNLRSLYNCKY